MPTWPSPASATVPDDRRAARAALLLVAALSAGPAAADDGPRVSGAIDAAAAGMVDVRTLAPDIEVEMRYATADNFTGAPVPGYEANRCLLLEPAARALARVQATLRAQGYGLRIYDCYRPAHAVRSFVRWVATPDDPVMKARWYPHVDKTALMPGYIAQTSGHSRGATVDLTLARCDAGGCAPLDMGTPYDFFDPSAHTEAGGLSVDQRAHRDHLRAAMAAQGMAHYPMEWWHYTLKPEPDPGTAYDFPVR